MTQRTAQQNKALHLWCELLADALNDAGIDLHGFYELTKGKLDVSWNKDLVKDKLWRPYQIALTKKESTAEPDVMEYPDIYKEVDKRIAELTGVHVEWPSEDRL